MFTKKLKLKKIGFLILLAFVCFYSAQASTFYYKGLSGVISGPEAEPFYYTAPSDVQLSFSNETVSINQGNSEDISYSLTGEEANAVTLSVSSSNESIISNSDISLDITNSQVSIPSSATNTKGSTNITLTATDVKGNVIVTDSVSISILGLDGDYQLTSWTVDAGETVSFPFNSDFISTYSGNIDWGDGSAIESFSNVKIQSLSHTYVDSGTYEIKIDGDFCDETSFYAMFRDQTIPSGFDISSWDTSSVTNMGYTFDGAVMPSEFDISNWNVGNVTSMRGMFIETSGLTSLDLSTWDVSKVESMRVMFYNVSSLTTVGDLSDWNTSNVTDMSYMFSGANSLTTVGDLSNWDVSNVTSMVQMFLGASSLTNLNLSNWDVSNVTSMFHIFSGMTGITTLGDLSDWNTSSVTNMASMFYNSTNLTALDLSGWDVSNVTSMNLMFYNTNSLTTVGDLSSWNVSNITDMGGMFLGANSLTSLNLSSWNISNVTNTTHMFNNNFLGNITYNTTMSSSLYSSFLQLLANTDTALPDSTTSQEIVAGSNACDASDTDCFDARTTLESKGWIVNDATVTISIDEATALDTRWIVSAGETVTFPCHNSYSGVIDWGDGTLEEYSDLSSTSHTYENAGTYTILMNGNWGTSLANMFGQKTLPAGFDISNWNVSNITNMSGLFFGVTIPAGFDISSWDVSNVTNMDGMFAAAMMPDNFSFNGWNVSSSSSYNNMLASLFLGDLVYDETVSSATYSKFVQLLVDAGLSVASMGQRLYVGNNTCPVDDTACSSAEATLVSTNTDGDIPGKGWSIVRTTAE